MDIRSRESTGSWWMGYYRGVRYDIQKGYNTRPRRGEVRDIWEYQISLQLSQIEDAEMRKRFTLLVVDHYGWGWEVPEDMPDLKFHGGTLFNEERSWIDNETGKQKFVTVIGCDYQHYADEGVEYNVKSIRDDAVRTIELFREQVPITKLKKEKL